MSRKYREHPYKWTLTFSCVALALIFTLFAYNFITAIAASLGCVISRTSIFVYSFFIGWFVSWVIISLVYFYWVIKEFYKNDDEDKD